MKAEQKPIWSREDEQNLNAALGYIDDEYLRRWLKDAIYNKYEKPTCSEKDETSIAINNPDAYRIGFADGEAHAKEEMTTACSEEDGRIRKDLISHFKETIENIRSEEIIPHHAKILVGKMQKWIAWLENTRTW